MSAADVPHTAPPAMCEGSFQALRVVSCQLFDALADLHGFSESDCGLLSRAVSGIRFMRSGDHISAVEHSLFHRTLVDLETNDTWVVEAAAHYAADQPADCEIDGVRRATPNDHTRALWFGALLRLSDALHCLSPRDTPTAVNAAWTDDMLFLEFEGGALREHQLQSARSKVAALELLAGRRVFLASPPARRTVLWDDSAAAQRGGEESSGIAGSG